MSALAKILPGTGRWQPQADGGAAIRAHFLQSLCSAQPDPSVTAAPRHLPVPGRISRAKPSRLLRVFALSPEPQLSFCLTRSREDAKGRLLEAAE